jgi:small GTP-binding protein
MSDTSPVLQKKVCMLGAYAVGKTSLVARFVRGIFSDKYLTTVGVKIDKKTVQINDREVSLIVWDLAGEDEFYQVRMSYMKGSAGYLLIADGTRRTTLEKALELQERTVAAIGEVPFIMLINKLDLMSSWEIKEDDINSLSERGWKVVATSARTGAGVEETFLELGQMIVGS